MVTTNINVSRLDKKQKKQLQQLVNKGLTNEYEYGFQEVKNIILQWEKEKLSARDGWEKLYLVTKQRERTIGKRFSDRRSKEYCNILASLLRDRLLEQDDLAGLSKEVESYILRLKQRFEYNHETTIQKKREDLKKLTQLELVTLKEAGFKKAQVEICESSQDALTGKISISSRTLLAINFADKQVKTTQELGSNQQSIEDLVWKEVEAKEENLHSFFWQSVE